MAAADASFNTAWGLYEPSFSAGAVYADIDGDGDLDLFVGGRVLPGSYPKAVGSAIYRNDSKPGHPKFTDVTATVAKHLLNIGLICDALFTDFNGDGATDLIVAGEWMQPQFFKNASSRFQNVTSTTGLQNRNGWWNSIAAGDFGNDGDIDYVIGNLGTNSFYRASAQYPAKLYAKDFDKNGSYDAIPVLYLKDENGQRKEFTAQSRDELTEQLPFLKKRSLRYKDFGAMDIHSLFTSEELKGATVYQAQNFSSCLFINDGNGKFRCKPLPVQAQLSVIYGMAADDFNGDGNLDISLNGNDYGTEVTNGGYDGLDGLVLLGDGTGNFSAQSIAQSGLFIPGDGKALVKLKDATNHYLLAASQNNGPLKVFESRKEQRVIPLNQSDRTIVYTLRNGKKRKEEHYCGNSFLSQSAAFVVLTNEVEAVEIADSKGQKQTVKR